MERRSSGLWICINAKNIKKLECGLKPKGKLRGREATRSLEPTQPVRQVQGNL